MIQRNHVALLLIGIMYSSISVVALAKSTSKDPLVLFEKGQVAFKQKNYTY